MTKSTTNRPLTEEQWRELGDRYINGEPLKKLGVEYGVAVSSMFYRSKLHQWNDRKRCLRLGIPFNPDGIQAGAVSSIGVNQEVEFDEARTLRGRHGKLYYQQLEKLRKQIDHIDALVLKCEDPMQLDQLTKSLDRLNERYRIIQGISGPAVLKGEREKKVKSAPILPLDG